MNKFGEVFRLTTFGESHGPALGGVIDGIPSGVKLDLNRVQQELDRRRPGQSPITSQRSESDRVEFLSGIFEGVTTGTPIGFIIPNSNQRPADYEEMRHKWRPSHADMTYAMKYGVRDHRGGGRASARETAARVVGGAVARQVLEMMSGVSIHAYTSKIGPEQTNLPYTLLNLDATYTNAVRCPDAEAAARMERYVERVKSSGDTVGGIVKGVVSGVPAGLGQPVFDKLQSRLAAAMLSIPAAKGFDYGLGFDECCSLGSELIDVFTAADGHVSTATNHSGGIQGGISNGADIYFRVAFKPVATLLREVPTITDSGEPTILHAKGRHDPCVVPRAVPVVEAMAAMVFLDALLADKTVRL
ncbi:MAG: chorismate synthase [Firmicutes bacterium]|nr:chorismate synthase [Bacillota bacterium]MCM1400671.1 chorismate synthase [Bacteroides sp.]MCM1476365.1 chorismate synthase [Bacteroides sp.]